MYYNDSSPFNGYDYVDLGLPSGTLWATCNVGATKPSDYGKYFQWGDVQGYTQDQIGCREQVGKGKGKGKKAFTWTDYKFNIDGSFSNFSKYTTKGATLELEDDAAHVNMGGSWHIPTPDQIKELINNTTSEWTIQDGVNGMTFTSTNGKSIFIPAAGHAENGSLIGSGDYGHVWSSMLNSSFVSSGQHLNFSSGHVGLDFNNRSYGYSVRGVIG